MKNIFTHITSVIAGHKFFAKQYLSDSSVAAGQFKLALEEARDYYSKRKHLKIDPALIHESWLQNIAALESYFVGQMSESFMSNEVINGTMVFTNRKAHKLELKNLSDAFDKDLIAEVVSKGLNSALISGKSHRPTLINSTHHLHHLMRFEKCTGKKIDAIESAVEFGGGYGNMARIVQNVAACKTYSIVDLLLFSCIQYVFLSTVAGNDKVVFNDGKAQEKAKFVLHPLLKADSPTNLRGELFISTWALSESTRAAYEWVNACNWFGAENILLAYNKHWMPWRENELEESLASNGWRVVKEEITFLPESFYLFATR